ncbi:MAG TPA: glycoside hydrolase family 13 protein [Gaiellaceae bacterium]|nr:glycoside hydrolase family 13 protein [Gaiellaceae bacterium]
MAAIEETTLLAEPHHDGSELYVLERPDELGGEAVVRLRTRRGAATQVLLRTGWDGEPTTIAAKVDEETDGETWWSVRFPVMNPVTRYRFLIAGGEAGYAWVNGMGAHPYDVGGADDFVLALGDAPSWHAESVGYQIFPDRFARSGASYDPPADFIRKEWDELPAGRGRTNPLEWFGGDLPGIEQHLDHIASLASFVYLTPFFPAGSTHRYDATSFERVDPLLGGDAALASLAEALHARGLKLLGDLTLNHTGVTHEWFPAERDFYYFDESLPYGYATWLNVKSLPKLNWSSERLHERMQGVIRKWLDAGLDGWRIDVANMVGRFRETDLNHEVARWTRAAANGSLVVAEHGHDFRTDLDGTGWHGVMNYAGFLRPAWWWLRDTTRGDDVFTSAPAPAYDGEEMVAVMRRFRSGVPWQTVLNSWTLLDSHDTPRFRTTVGGDPDLVHAGIGLQMTTPGVPVIYAGDELGLDGAWGEDGRRPMPWSRPDNWDNVTLERYRALSQLRRSTPALARGGMRYVHVSADTIAYVRETREDRLLCQISRVPGEIAYPFSTLDPLYESPNVSLWRIS